MSGIDRRIIKTKKAIRNAFAELLSEQELNSITVKDIADKADINRKTFYNYYNGVYQVIDEIENELIHVFESSINDVDFQEAMRDPQPVFEKLTAIISNDIEFYGYLMKMNENVSLVSKISDLLKFKVREAFTKQIGVSDEKLDIIVNYSINGMISAYQMWFNSDRKYPLDKFSDDVGTIAFSGINGLVNSAK
jgi:AcrR family transcriptional regulator